MESTAQCDWEGGFLQCPSNEGQRPQWEAIKPLVLNLQATGKTSPCAGREREGGRGGKGGDGILPRDLTLEAMPAILNGNADYLPCSSIPHLCYIIFLKETSYAMSKIQPENLCPPMGHKIVTANVSKGMVSRSICTMAPQVKQDGLKWGTKLNPPKHSPSPYFFNVEQYKEKAPGCPCSPKARRGVQDSSERHIPVQRSKAGPGHTY